MNAANTLHPIVELRRFVAGCLRAIRTTRHVDAELMFDGAAQIADELVTERIERERRLQQQIAKAQAPSSPGGRMITAAEIAPVVAEAGATIAILATPEVAA